MPEDRRQSARGPAGPIPYGKQSIDDSDIEAVVSVLRSDFVTQGPVVGEFESALAEYTGARYAVAVSSGTAALHLACQALDLGAGDRGIVPAITFAATANCLRYVGAEPGFCDVDPVTGLSGSAEFQAALDQGPAKALLPVSYAGSASELAAVASLAHKSGAYVIEDAAHSIGARYRDRQGRDFASASCSHSDAAILSFHPVKHVCAGEGGAILTNDETLARRSRRLRSHGMERGPNWLYDQVELGSHYRMTEMQAALGKSQLLRLPAALHRRRRLALRYEDAFAQEPFASRVRLSNCDDGSARHLFVVHFESAERREAAYRFLHERSVRAQVHYKPVYRHSYYQGLGCKPLPSAEAFYAGCLSLPLYPSLGEDEQDYVIEALRRFFLEA